MECQVQFINGSIIILTLSVQLFAFTKLKNGST